LALHEHWGLSLHRGGATSDDKHDGRWDAAYSRTGFVVSGHIPRRGYGDYRYATLRSVVHAFELAKVIELAGRPRRSSSSKLAGLSQNYGLRGNSETRPHRGVLSLFPRSEWAEGQPVLFDDEDTVLLDKRHSHDLFTNAVGEPRPVTSEAPR